ncbi:plasmid replication initiator TrfA [Tepidiphilus baoligensis]|uniref:TrfA protein n=1 Tax=Tepidiphilus baoligensis TaxID=2698687 RepID=A0ABX1QNI5_9PROT|nr:plasmid replication initiator TrfA [Tepidiphilus baoligensis]NMH17495.1 hypothetical protein [Tepidiphilus baoligensis]
MAEDNDSTDEALAGLPADIQETLKRALATAKARKAKEQEQKPQQQSSALPAAVEKLPLWPESVRAVPNGFLRSALFGAIRKGRRRFMEREVIAALEGIELRYTGQRLDQSDLDVYECILQLARFQPLGTKCHVTAYALLKLLGRTVNGKNRQTLHDQIVRLRSGTVEIKHGRYVYIGGLIDEAFKDEKTHEWVIVINPKLANLYAKDAFTLMQWGERLALAGQPLAQWLHGFYSSHAKPHPIKVETLRQLSGSENESLSSFRQKMRVALDAMAKVTGWTWETEAISDLVYVYKTPTGSQARHLIFRALKGKGSTDPKK